MTYVATLSHLRRVNTQIEKTGKLVQPRKLHPTQWGVICPSETPEGASVGLVKNMALLTHITVATPSDPVRRALDDLGLVRFAVGAELANTAHSGRTPAEAVAVFKGATRVFVNGDLVGAHSDTPALVAGLRSLKRGGVLSAFTSIVWNVLGREVTICTEGGRFARPLMVADKETGAPTLLADADLAAAAARGAAAWHDLVLAGAVEYLDVDESNAAMIGGCGYRTEKNAASSSVADLSKLTHLEVSPYAFLGVVAGCIPYPDHNQAPRNTYQASWGHRGRAGSFLARSVPGRPHLAMEGEGGRLGCDVF
jgi:DNA-directed RNA polymerase beta subunit